MVPYNQKRSGCWAGVGCDVGSGLYTQPVPTEKIPGYWVFFGYWVYLFRTYLVNFCMGKYLIPKYPVVPTFWVLCRIEILRDFETFGDSFGLCSHKFHGIWLND